MSSANDGTSKRVTYPKVLMDRNHEVSFSCVTGYWYVSIIGSDKTFTASAKTLRAAADAAIAKTKENSNE